MHKNNKMEYKNMIIVNYLNKIRQIVNKLKRSQLKKNRMMKLIKTYNLNKRSLLINNNKLKKINFKQRVF